MDESSGDVNDGLPGTALPLQASLVLDSDSSRIAQARHLAAAFLTKARDTYGIAVATATLEIVQLIVSELVTNARKHAPGPALLHLRIAGPVLRVELWDSNPALPTAKAPDPGRLGQHGLEIVTALARTVAVERTPAGKCIIAYIDLAPAAA
ncbi:ATP-binding protein [Streptomyces rhizosphaerihabitans]|uniref:ATP-binding protein n=1 Tax=Streptomyces rhizosphaerihabitans TaxID=1266770 RepID=UPI0021C03D01|nr:ATP-binding protein [Streptomyces rhizosphaerihabitans]MCT9007308.1 ATP-binding protein [Streptomyces rhizosphaerihabitans]